jgi:hypothetical protein
MSATNDVFIVGPVRSGTSWLQTMLAEHPALASPPETHLFANYLGPLDAVWRDDRARVAASLDPKHRRVALGLATVVDDDEFVGMMRSVYASMRHLVLAAKPGASRLLEKTPDHALHIDTIKRVVPGASIVYVVRDPRDTVRSVLQASGEDWGDGWAPASLDAAIALWLRNVRPYFPRKRDPALMMVRYEDLRADPATLDRVAKFVGLDAPSEWMHTPIEASPSERTSMVVRGHIGDGQWNAYDAEGFSFHRRTSRRELSAYEAAYVVLRCRDEMRALGYPVDLPDASLRAKARVVARSWRRRADDLVRRATHRRSGSSAR